MIKFVINTASTNFIFTIYSSSIISYSLPDSLSSAAIIFIIITSRCNKNIPSISTSFFQPPTGLKAAVGVIGQFILQTKSPVNFKFNRALLSLKDFLGLRLYIPRSCIWIQITHAGIKTFIIALRRTKPRNG